jgi:prepilin-type N-terminal cleavage/methylation domain-containing protein
MSLPPPDSLPPAVAAHATRAAGFTLIEMLAAVTIMALLMVMLFAALNQGQRGWKQSAMRTAAYESGRALLQTMANDLVLAVNTTTNKQFVGQPSTVYFVTAQSESASPKTNNLNVCEVTDLSWVGYELVSGTPGGLRRKQVAPVGTNVTSGLWGSHVYGVATAGDPGAERLQTSNTVVNLTLSYGGAATWSTTGLPRSVRIVLETVDADTVRRYTLSGNAALLDQNKRRFETQVYLSSGQ